MTRFENSEIMLNYAALMEPKVAAGDVVDFAQELAVEVPIALATDIAIGAAVVAAPFVFGGAPAVGGAAVAGTSLLALMGGPVGVAIGLSVAVGIAIWNVTKIADDKVDGLIKRLQALDADSPGTQKYIDNWITNLNSFKPYLELPLTTTNPRERVQINNTKLAGLTKLHTYLVRMQKEWEGLASRLTDWGWDPGQAKTSIDETLTAMTRGLADAKLAMRNSVQEFITAAGKEKQESYSRIAQNIQKMWNELTNLHGKSPTFDSAGEKAGYDLAISIIKGEVAVENFDKNFNNMVGLHNLLEQGLKQSKQQERAVTSGIKANFSKRALTLGNGQMVSMTGQSVPAKVQKRKQKSGSRVVKSLQNVINKLNYVYNAGAGTIEEDGIYGPITADALAGVLSSDWRIGNIVAQNAKVNIDTVKNVAMMRQRPWLIKAVYRVLSPIATKIEGLVPGYGIAGKTRRRDVGISQRDVKQPSRTPSRRARCRWDDIDVTDHDDVISCLQEFKVKDIRDDEWRDAYSWLRGLNIKDEKLMVKLITTQFPPDRIKPTEWSAKIFTRYVLNRLGGSEGGSRLIW